MARRNDRDHHRQPIRLASTGWTSLLVVNATTADHLVLDLTGPARTVRLHPYDASDAALDAVTVELQTGLKRLEAPRYGLCRINEVGADI